MSVERAVFIGSKTIGAKVLETMYAEAPNQLIASITINDVEDKRSALKRFNEFEQRTGKKLFVLERGSQLKSIINQLRPEICIVVGWYWVLSSELLEMVPNGFLGIHASLLPKYRGGSPLVWAILNGETETGISLFYFDEGMDTGDLVAQKKIPIKHRETIKDVLCKAEDKSQEIIEENYRLLLAGKAHREPQDQQQATYAALRTSEDGRIDWSNSARSIFNFIRAQTHPYPGAFCVLDSNTRLRIWEADEFPFPYFGAPGQVTLKKDDQVVVTCGGGTGLCLKSVQLDNQEVQNPADVLKFGQKLC